MDDIDKTFVSFFVIAIAVIAGISWANGASFKDTVNWISVAVAVYVFVYIIKHRITKYKGMRPIVTMPIIAANTGIRVQSADFPTVVEDKGVAFAISMWMYVNSLKYGVDKEKDIFRKGNFRIYLDNKTNDLHVSVPIYPVSDPNDSASGIKYNVERITFEDFPLNKWVNLVLTVDHRTVDLWLNGRLYRSIHLNNLIYFNNADDVYFISDTQAVTETVNGVTKKVVDATRGGYDGYISRIHYHDHILSRDEVMEIFNLGPYPTGFMAQIGERIMLLFTKDISSTRNETIKFSGSSKNYENSSEFERVMSEAKRANQSVLRLR
jgi:hypothetical protein